MTLKKQTIRSNHTIYLNRSESPAEKGEIISLSESWTENEEFLFRKLLKQGGSVNIQGNHFKIVPQEKFSKLRDM
jgi:hypothetical protein